MQAAPAGVERVDAVGKLDQTITNPAAASGVRPGWTLKRPGRTRPSAPSTSATPMNRRTRPGSGIGIGSVSGGTLSVSLKPRIAQESTPRELLAA
jgi:hypothetical protein